MLDEFLYVEKYRPHKIVDTILPTNLKTTFQSFVDQGNIPNLILSGTSGLGKTTVARAMLEEIGADYIIINASMDGNIDTLRNTIQQFASTISFTGNRKFVILDEADGLNSNSTQVSLRAFMEVCSKNCGFIFTCNVKSKLIDAIHSRCSVVDFTIPTEEKPKLATQFMKRVEFILKDNSIIYDKQVIATIIQRYFPDFRRIINELQSYSANGKIDSGILVAFKELPIEQVFKLMKNKEFDALRKMLIENDTDTQEFFHSLYKNADKFVVKSTIPILILKIAEYDYKNAFVQDKIINLLAFCVEIMSECEFN